MVKSDEEGELIEAYELPKDEEIYTTVCLYIFKKEAEPFIQKEFSNF